MEDQAPEGPTTIVPTENGSLRVRGDLRIETQRGDLLGEASDVWLCRCGQSANRPFCDSSHKRVGFESCATAVAAERAVADSPQSFEPNPEVG